EHVSRISGELIEVRPADDKLNVGIPRSSTRESRYGVDAGAQLIRKFFLIPGQNLRASAQHQIVLRSAAVLERSEFDVDVREVNHLLLAAANRHQRVRDPGKFSHVAGNS